MKQLKVYGWFGRWMDPRNTNNYKQARFIMAAWYCPNFESGSRIVSNPVENRTL